METPLHNLPILSNLLGIDLWAKRDDLLPMCGGGNKVRKAVPIFDKAKIDGCNAVITTGGLQSNHARVCALTAARLGWPCHLILHGDSKQADNPKGNLLIAALTGAVIKIVGVSEIKSTLETTQVQLKKDGLIPYLVPGGGHCLEGSLSYYNALLELNFQCVNAHWIPELIVFPSGTGTTHAGILAGVGVLKWPTQVLGISIARKNPRGRDIVCQAYFELCTYLGQSSIESDVHFLDEWVGGGYELADDHVFKAIRLAAVQEGFILDPTYTGKAFSALLAMVEWKKISPGTKVLFWHTGGLFNLLSTDYTKELLQI